MILRQLRFGRAEDILLNDRPVFLRGICIHEENPMRGGQAYSVEDARMLLGWAKELNANFVRLALCPHPHGPRGRGAGRTRMIGFDSRHIKACALLRGTVAHTYQP
jgi:hypothetical protein